MFNDLEFAILNAIQGLRTPLGDWLMPLITALGNGGLLWILIGVALIWRGARREGLLVLAALAIEALLCNGILKPLFDLPRPCEINQHVELLIPRPSDASFPSGHTGASFAAVTALWLGGVRRWQVALVVAILIAFSRLYLYVHYPSDVLAGMILGVLCALLAAKLVALAEVRFGGKGRRRKRGNLCGAAQRAQEGNFCGKPDRAQQSEVQRGNLCGAAQRAQTGNLSGKPDRAQQSEVQTGNFCGKPDRAQPSEVQGRDRRGRQN